LSSILDLGPPFDPYLIKNLCHTIGIQKTPHREYRPRLQQEHKARSTEIMRGKRNRTLSRGTTDAITWSRSRSTQSRAQNLLRAKITTVYFQTIFPFSFFRPAHSPSHFGSPTVLQTLTRVKWSKLG